MSYNLSRHLTPGRLRVLEHIERNPNTWAPCFGPAKNQCFKLGWIMTNKNEKNEIIGQTLTDKGRLALKAHRATQSAKPNPIICHHDCFLGCKLPATCQLSKPCK